MTGLWFHRLIYGCAICAGMAGCASYHPAPLNLTPGLQTSVAALNHTLPNGGAVAQSTPMTMQNIAALAVLNSPDLIAARTQHNIAAAELLSVGLLPDPAITGGFAALISGPANVPSITGSLAQDISALITYRASVKAAKAGLAQVDASILWQEWQAASQAEQLSINTGIDAQTVASLRQDQAALTAVNNSTNAQVAAGNLTIAASSASAAALATNNTALNTAIQAQAQDRDSLDALLGLQPGIDIPVAGLNVPPVDPARADQAINTLPYRRPDLIALRYGYEQANAKLRVAILTQFLPVSLGATGGRDTTNVVSAGPQITLTLPLFNRNRGGIATATATRAQLAAQFQANLASAAGAARALLAKIAILETESHIADQQAVIASNVAAQAQQAFANGSLDALSAVNLQTASADRQRESIALHGQVLTARLSLVTLLGLGLPPLATTGLEAAP